MKTIYRKVKDNEEPDGMYISFKDPTKSVHQQLKEIQLPTKEEIDNIIEMYFKKWNGKGFDKPTHLEKQRFDACANAIYQLLTTPTGK